MAITTGIAAQTVNFSSAYGRYIIRRARSPFDDIFLYVPFAHRCEKQGRERERTVKSRCFPTKRDNRSLFGSNVPGIGSSEIGSYYGNPNDIKNRLPVRNMPA